MRCHQCQKELNEEVGVKPINDWFKIMHYLEIELTEGNITSQTYEVLSDAMMSIRPEDDEQTR